MIGANENLDRPSGWLNAGSPAAAAAAATQTQAAQQDTSAVWAPSLHLNQRPAPVGSGSGGGGEAGVGGGSGPELAGIESSQTLASADKTNGLRQARVEHNSGEQLGRRLGVGVAQDALDHPGKRFERDESAAKGEEEAAAAAKTSDRGKTSGFQFSTVGLSLATTGCEKNVAQAAERPRQNNSTGGESLCQRLIMLTRQPCFIWLIWLCLLIGACLLGALAIGRQRATTNLNAASQEAKLMAAQAAETFEVRTLQLVDLIEHDKTFAYTRWQVAVRVVKTAPAFKQHTSSSSSSSKLNEEAAERRDSNQIQGSELSPTGSEEKAEFVDADESQFQMTGTRAFMENQHQASMPTNKSGINLETNELLATRLDLASDEALELDTEEDPIQMAASELQVDRSSINSTLVDCFIVDLDKRYGQKTALEVRHAQVANTRQIGFKRMLATITACRLLAWATLSSQKTSASAAAPTQPPASSIGQRSKLLTKRDQRERQAGPSRDGATGSQSSRANSGVLAEIIRPVEREVRRTAQQVDLIGASRSQAPQKEKQEQNERDPLGSLIGALISWSRLPNASSQTSGGNERRSNLPKLLETGEEAPASASGGGGGGGGGPSANLNATAPEVGRGDGRDDEEAKRASYLSVGMSMMSGIVPNTLWCGLGDRAANYSELGSEFKVDACCRAHDHCPIRLKPFTADYGLINWSMSTRSHCDCDLDFSECLTSINSTLSNVIKTLYFRFVGLQCIDLEATRRRSLAPNPVEMGGGRQL